MEFETLTAPTVRYQLFLGGTVGYSSRKFDRLDLLRAVESCLQNNSCKSSFNITEVTFARMGYSEAGFRIETVNYPTRVQTAEEIYQELQTLAAFLMARFEQERISIVSDTETVLLQRKKEG